jgi:hypothetical protein
MSIETEPTDASDVPEVEQYEDEPVDELSDLDDFPLPMPTMRRPRQAHNQAHDAQLAQYMKRIMRPPQPQHRQ